MKKIVIYLLISAILAGLLSFFSSVSVSDAVLNTIYTVAGVIFSVGMSIAITPKTEKVTNVRMRAEIRLSYQVVRDSFMYLFGVSTMLFILTKVWEMPHYPSFCDIMCTLFILLTIIYYIHNFVELQKLGLQIEDQVLKEESEKNKHTNESDEV